MARNSNCIHSSVALVIDVFKWNILTKNHLGFELVRFRFYDKKILFLLTGGSSSAAVINPLAALIAPLAALALLGAAAAVALNPVLVQVAVITGGKRRRRRSLDHLDSQSKRQLEEMEKLEDFLTKVPNTKEQSEQMLANYVDCSGLAMNSQCLEHLVCLYSNPLAYNGGLPITSTEKDVIAM